MQFTDRYISLPGRLMNTKKAQKAEDMGIEDSQEFTEVTLRINPLKVVSYFETPDFTGGDDPIHTAVELEGGHAATICLPVKEFERLMNSF